MATFDIHASKTALLVIDMQNAFVAPGGSRENPRGRDIIPGLNRVIRACRKAGILTIFTQHCYREDGSDLGLSAEFMPDTATKSSLIRGTPDADIYDEIETQKGDIRVTKCEHSAFCGTDLDLLLRINGIDTLIICGVDTVACVEATARDARHRNYKVIFLSDGTATRDRPDMGWGAFSADEAQRFVLTFMAMRYAEVLSVKEVLTRIQRANPT
ncbi:cysteine hydrolase family protein [Chloroflexota bacterium]